MRFEVEIGPGLGDDHPVREDPARTPKSPGNPQISGAF
jgi:hypothetical protein